MTHERLVFSRDERGGAVRVPWTRRPAWEAAAPAVATLATAIPAVVGGDAFTGAQGVAFVAVVALTCPMWIVAFERAVRGRGRHRVLARGARVDERFTERGYRAARPGAGVTVEVDGAVHALAEARVVVTRWREGRGEAFGVVLAFPGGAYEIDRAPEEAEARAVASDVASALGVEKVEGVIDHRPFMIDDGRGARGWSRPWARLGGAVAVVCAGWTFLAAVAAWLAAGSREGVVVAALAFGLVPLGVREALSSVSRARAPRGR